MSFDPHADAEHLRETLVSRRAIFAGRLLHVYQDEVRLPDGRPAGREIVQHRGAVAIVPVAPDGRVVLVRQWRHAVERALWEIPAGTRDEGEEPFATARRELAEETGYTAASWRSLGEACVAPGYSSELLWFYLAESLTSGETSTDPDEKLDVRLFEPSEVAQLLSSGATDMKTVAGLALAGRLPALDGVAL
ncbi:MAG TPA: NUDIX hydrolase [Candidatus Angelobacter sp.]|nr:NUDIX hydrolase [Candidatus Angelobacter sp.]